MSYVTVADMRAEGVPDAITDTQVQAALDECQAIIERETRQWFESRALTVDLDGLDSPTLWLPVPIIALTALYMNDDMDNAVDTTLYRAFIQRNQIQDDRRNPKVQLITNTKAGIYDMPAICGRFSTFIKGMKQRLVGTFGYVDTDGDGVTLITPPPIKRALKVMAARQLSSGNGTVWGEQGSVSPASNRVVSETTDGHSISYDAARTQATRAGSNSVTGSAEVDRILTLFKGPLLMGVPGSYTYHYG